MVITRNQEVIWGRMNNLWLENIEFIIPKNEEEILKDIADVNIITWIPFLISPYVNKAEKLEWLQSSFAWIDALIKPDLKSDYILTNVKDIYGMIMAEYVLGYILVHTKDIIWNLKSQEKSVWKQVSYAPLSTKTVWIMGTGSIGKEIAKQLSGFWVKVIWYATTQKTVEYFHTIYTKKTQEDFISQCDFIVSVLPYTPETDKIINADFLQKMKKTAILINVWRGLNVDEEALQKALETEQIAGAVLDVFQKEPLDENHPLWKTKNCIVTPHISGYSSSFDDYIHIFADNYKKFVAGEELDYLIDFTKWY